MVSLTVSQARASLPELLTRVEEGEEVTITRHGRAVAVMVRPDVLRARAHVVIDDALRIHELVAGGGASELPAGAGISEQRAEELIREIRAGRDQR